MQRKRRTNRYVEMSRRHQKEFNEFPKVFAFNQEDALKKLDMPSGDSDEICSFGDTGCYYRKCDAPAFQKMLDRQRREREDAVRSDRTGSGFIYDMFSCVLANQEFAFTFSIEDTLDYLGYTRQEVLESKALLNGLNKALKKYGVVFEG